MNSDVTKARPALTARVPAEMPSPALPAAALEPASCAATPPPAPPGPKPPVIARLAGPPAKIEEAALAT